MSPQSVRPTYTEDQIRRYLDYIRKQDRIAIECCDTEAGLKYLNELILLQLSKVPFENLDLHYSTHHSVSLDTEFLFEKIVDRKAGRGGYCMQNNLFFATVLRSLGYKVMPCGARVSSAVQGDDPAKAQYSGWEHTVNLVFIDGRKYFVDVAFGANCPSFAVSMVDDWTGRRSWSDFDDMLLKRQHILDNTFAFEEQKLWVFHIRSAQDKPWSPMYCFSEVEFLPQDFRVSNYYVSNSRTSWFTYSIVCTKCILDDRGNNIGDLTLFIKVVKETKYGKSKVLQELKSEEERVQALHKYFNITLTASEANGIQGYVSMLR